jgi:hypothetical protein
LGNITGPENFSKGRKVRGWYIEAGGFHPLDLSNRLLPNLPQATEYKA